MPPEAPCAEPLLSVIVPTYARPERVERLLARLDAQTLAPDRFEVVLVDDGSPVPIAVDRARHRFDVRVLRQANAGPGSARNLGVRESRAPLVLFLNDDAVPADDLLAVHLDVHAHAPDKTVVLGTFPFTRAALEDPFTELLSDSDLLFDFPRLAHGELHGWTFFWTCNLSLPKSALGEVGGFDPEFREAIVEDVELGYRLAARGWRVLYRDDARCEHEHALTPEAYFRRALRLGVNLARMWKKHGDPTIVWQPDGTKLGRDWLFGMQAFVEAHHASVASVVDSLARRSERLSGRRPRTHRNGRRPSVDMASRASVPELREPIQKLVRWASTVGFARGVLLEITGTDPGAVIDVGPSKTARVSIVACSHDALAKTQKCVESLRRTLDPEREVEILFVDNGSVDGSADWLEAQSDVQLIRNRENLGAPRARNQALARASGDYVVFLDNDVVLTPEWLERMLFHAEVDARTGCVAARSDRASHGQEIRYDGPTDFDSVAAFAAEVARDNDRKSSWGVTFASFCLLVKRSVIDAIGGFDERFSPWGFEDDDYTLRAVAAGFTNRLALDVFVRHDAYTGKKRWRHAALLEENWRRFAKKWGLEDAAYGDVSKLRDVGAEPIERDLLHVAIGRETPGALPRRDPFTQDPRQDPRKVHA